MRVAIADSDVRAGRALAASIERLLPTVDVLLYTDTAAAVDGVLTHHPDVVFVAPAVGEDDGPAAAARVADVTPRGSSVVGIVARPDADSSVRFIDAGANVVVARPVDDLAIRTALRQHAGGIPGGS